MKQVLKDLGLDAVNAGTWLGANALETAAAPLIESINPANGEVIASVRSTTSGEYEKMLVAARESFLAWRKVPAPARG
ncbi:MAG: aldehyde dehydrogenase family protein, partial [Woeseiaceae bacterium]